MEPEKTPRERAEDLISLVVTDWRPTAEQVVWAIRIILATIVVLGLLTLVGRPFGIALWDWLKLLVVPAVIAGGGLWFNRQQRERELEIAERRTQDEALQAYLDQMSAMLIPNTDQPSLYKARPDDSLSSVARARTLTVLPRLASNRKARVVQFLHESGLITVNRRIVAMRGADLRGADLSEADLSGANLFRADLGEAYLIAADLRGADLRGADLRGANLIGANLIGANLIGANLIEADLRGTKLRGANLIAADLTEAYVTETHLLTAESLKGATMPNGQKYEDWLKDREGGKNE
jgi:hypothetical protein